MVYFVKFLYSTFLFPPGSILIAMLALVFYLYRRQPGLAKIISILTLVFYLSTISLVSDQLIGSLERKFKPPSHVSGDVIIMLGGGATLDTPNVYGLGHLSGFAANRLLTCAQLYHGLHVPILVSGGKVLETTGSEADIAKVVLIGLGVPADKIIVENQSLNTTENAKYTKGLVDKHGFTKPIVVTSAFHMQRAVLQFNKVHLSVLPYPTDYQTNLEIKFQPHQLWPTAGALLNVSLALKEYVGILAVQWY
ncbi:MAG: YdcF family protein [Sporomusaceae bacterium]|nr:YdcF family protein [Sporomusaceae bacterium]